MLSRHSLNYALAGCLLHTTFASAGVGIKIPIPIIINGTTVHTVAFSFLVIFSVLTGILFLGALARVFGGKDELPPDVSPQKYEVGRLFNWISFFAVTLWWSQIIIYTIYVRNVYMLRPRKHFPGSAYVARYTLDQLTDVCVAAATLYLVHYRRRNIHGAIIAPFSPVKKSFDAFITIVHVAIVGYTTAFLSFTVQDTVSDSKYLNWLTSYYVYTGVYVLVVINATTTLVLSYNTLKANCIVDEVSISVTFWIVALTFKPLLALQTPYWANPWIAHCSCDIQNHHDCLVFTIQQS